MTGMRPLPVPGWFLAFAAAVLGVACEHGITLRGTVTIPTDLQQQFSRARPGVILLEVSIPKSSVPGYRLAVLCEPTASPLVAPFVHASFGCAKEGVVRARLVPSSAAEAPACGVQQALWTSEAAEPVVAAGEHTVFRGQTGSFGCSSGEDSIEIVLQPVR